MDEPTRAAGLARLTRFSPDAGTCYQARRNFDVDRPAVSGLSHWLRHRLITEEEVLRSVLSHNDLRAAQSFVQEVFWRGYFKGWLEQHPTVWTAYKEDQAQALTNVGADYQAAITGRTGIACFDHWSCTLRTDGYLHNHARMWFASIWIFTLRLPWQLGAGFFLDHLRDGDPASNTLSWRWVAGLHTKGKHYLATADNIARFTEGRFNPIGQLTETAEPLTEKREHPLAPLALPVFPTPQRYLRVITEEDCGPSEPTPNEVAVLGIVSPESSAFSQDAVRNAVSDAGGEIALGHNWSRTIEDAAACAGTSDVVISHTPIGPTADGFAVTRQRLTAKGITVHSMVRNYDRLVWPHASKGFFKLKKQIPSLLKQLGLLVP